MHRYALFNLFVGGCFTYDQSVIAIVYLLQEVYEPHHPFAVQEGYMIHTPFSNLGHIIVPKYMIVLVLLWVCYLEPK